MGTAQAIFAEVLYGGATGSHVTRSDVSHVTGSGPDRKRPGTGSDVSHPEVCSAHAQPEVAQPFPAFFLTLLVV